MFVSRLLPLLPLTVLRCYFALSSALPSYAAVITYYFCQFCASTYFYLQMTSASDQPRASLSLGPAVAAPNQPVDVPPQVAVARPPSPVVNAGAPPQANGQPAGGPAPAAIPPVPAPSAAQNLTAQLLSVQPNMTLNQLTGILNILAPDRHMRSVASNLLRASQPLPPPEASNAVRSSHQSLPRPLYPTPHPYQTPLRVLVFHLPREGCSHGHKGLQCRILSAF